jgi:hypothetical protein
MRSINAPPSMSSTVERAHHLPAGPGYRVRMDIAITPKTRGDRTNTELAAVVEQAMAVGLEHGARAAARFLADHGAVSHWRCRCLPSPARAAHPLDLLPFVC